MKLIRVIKLQRVRYGDLDDGDEYTQRRYTAPLKKNVNDFWYAFSVLCPQNDELVAARDTDKYSPESVTYTIEGIDGSVWRNGYFYGLQEGHWPESEIETRYI